MDGQKENSGHVAAAFTASEAASLKPSLMPSTTKPTVPMNGTLQVEFEFNPPKEVLESNPDLAISGCHRFEFEVDPSSTKEEPSKEYYAQLHEAIMDAKELTGKELTAWKLAAGKTEEQKVVTAAAARPKPEEGSEDEEEEGQDEL